MKKDSIYNTLGIRLCGYSKSYRHVMFNQRAEFKYWSCLLRSLWHLCMPSPLSYGLISNVERMAIIYHYKSQIKPKKKCSIAAISRLQLLSSLDWVQNLLWIIFNPAAPSSRTKHCKLLATLSLYPWQMFRGSAFLSTTNSKHDS